jgi:hypothetical protein
VPLTHVQVPEPAIGGENRIRSETISTAFER